jgi:hypothetical protein
MPRRRLPKQIAIGMQMPDGCWSQVEFIRPHKVRELMLSADLGPTLRDMYRFLGATSRVDQARKRDLKHQCEMAGVEPGQITRWFPYVRGGLALVYGTPRELTELRHEVERAGLRMPSPAAQRAASKYCARKHKRST